MNNFQRKFRLFVKRCNQAGIAIEGQHKAFSIVLEWHGLQYYFDFLKQKNLYLEELEQVVREWILTPKCTHALLCKWESFNLNEIITEQAIKSLSACLRVIAEKLSNIQTSLPPEPLSERILCNKLLNAVKDVSSWQPVYYMLADTVQGVISDLPASLATSTK